MGPQITVIRVSNHSIISSCCYATQLHLFLVAVVFVTKVLKMVPQVELMAQKTIVIVSIVEKSLVVLVLVKVAAKWVLEEHNEKDFIHLRPNVHFH